MVDKVLHSISDIKESLLKGGFLWIFSSGVINKMIAFLSGIILVRIITKEGYGAYSYASNILSFFTMFTGLGIVSGLLQFASESQDKEHNIQLYKFSGYFGGVTNFILGLAIAATAVLIDLPIKGSNELLLLMCMLPLVKIYPDLQYSYLRAGMDTRGYSISNIFASFITAVISVIGAYYAQARGLVGAHYIAAIVSVIFAVIVLGVPRPFGRIHLLKDEMKSLVKLSIHSAINNSLSQLLYLLDVFILGIIIADNLVVADYKVATLIPTALSFIPSTVVIFIYPYFARKQNDKEWLLSNYRKTVLGLGSCCFLIAGFLCLLAPWIIRLVFGAQYLTCLVPFRILCISFACEGTFRTLSGNLLVTQRKLSFNTIVAIVSGVVNILFDIMFIKMWGSVGAAIATLGVVIVSGCMSTSYLIYVIKRK